MEILYCNLFFFYQHCVYNSEEIKWTEIFRKSESIELKHTNKQKMERHKLN